MQAPIEVSRREGEVFLLDILSHRMSVMEIFHQLCLSREDQCSVTALPFYVEFLFDISLGGANEGK